MNLLRRTLNLGRRRAVSLYELSLTPSVPEPSEATTPGPPGGVPATGPIPPGGPANQPPRDPADSGDRAGF
jgi:hypothetical protein